MLTCLDSSSLCDYCHPAVSGGAQHTGYGLCDVPLSLLTLCHAMQLSLVSRTLRSASAFLLTLHKKFDATAPPHLCWRRSIKLDGPFLLQWAVSLETLVLPDLKTPLRGLAQFLSAATLLSTLELYCIGQVAAEQHGDLLSRCRAVRHLVMRGCPQPGVIPTSIQQLSVMFGCTGSVNWDSKEVSKLVDKARELPQLQDLSLDLGFLDITNLTHSACLRGLRTLRVQFAVEFSSRDIDLSWFQHQECKHLELVIRRCSTGRGSEVVRQVTPLNLAHLTLDLRGRWPFELHEHWGRVTCGKLHVIVSGSGGFIHPTHSLRVLPVSCDITLEFTAACVGTTYMTWEVLTRHHGSFKLILAQGVSLTVLDTSDSAPDNLQQPWQLVVTGAGTVRGLPTSQPSTVYKYFLQNAAA